MKVFTSAVVLTVVLAGCAAPITQQAKQDMAQPVDCTTAQGDLRSLNAEKAHVSTEIKDGVTSIVPIGLVAHLFMRDEKSTFEVGTGEYNRALDKKIAEIKSTCGIQ